MPNPGLCQGCQGQLERYPAAPDAAPTPNPSPPPAPLAGPEEEEGEILRTVKYNNVIPLPPGGAPPPTGPTLSRSQEILKDTFDDIMSEEDDLQATMRFRGVMKVPLPTKAPEKTAAPAPKEAPAKLKAVKKKKTAAPGKKSGQKTRNEPASEEGGDGLAGKIVIVAILSLMIGIGLTTALLYYVKGVS
ncbi:MAG: hypothetical protein P1V97_12340 [Planctomycetota bacterium]|nr:hypothetical protein [Planctomycetota bacterium]